MLLLRLGVALAEPVSVRPGAGHRNGPGGVPVLAEELPRLCEALRPHRLHHLVASRVLGRLAAEADNADRTKVVRLSAEHDVGARRLGLAPDAPGDIAGLLFERTLGLPRELRRLVRLGVVEHDVTTNPGPAAFDVSGGGGPDDHVVPGTGESRYVAADP